MLLLMACNPVSEDKPEKQPSFYRLKIVDKDGSFVYSKAIRVDL